MSISSCLAIGKAVEEWGGEGTEGTFELYYEFRPYRSRNPISGVDNFRIHDAGGYLTVEKEEDATPPMFSSYDNRFQSFSYKNKKLIIYGETKDGKKYTLTLSNQ